MLKRSKTFSLTVSSQPAHVSHSWIGQHLQGQKIRYLGYLIVMGIIFIGKHSEFWANPQFGSTISYQYSHYYPP